MTNPVIESVRRSLSRTGTRTISGRTAQSAPSLRPDIYPPRQPESTNSEIERFLSEIKKLSGVSDRFLPDGISAALPALVSAQKIQKATVWETSFLQKLNIANIIHSLGVELVSPNASKYEMALCDLGITEADYLLPETGTIVLRSSAEMARGVSLLPRIHLAVVRPEMLRADMHQVFAEAKDSHYLVFITGPSRTADIELTTTLGVHGPKELFVWMLEE
jgi:L-lactate dehydrogenase complex protein LldG